MNAKSRAGVCRPRPRSLRRTVLAVALLAAGMVPAFAAEFTVVERPIADLKAVFATVESLHSTAARSRNGGTIDHLSIQEGDRVTLAERLAVVTDPKLPLQLAALDARIQALLSQQKQARIDLDRMQQLMKSGNVTRANLDQAQTAVAVIGATLAAQQAERAVVAEQLAEGDVLAPANGRVLKVHMVDGTVVMPGETVADIATADYVLRMRLPERHAKFIHQGDKVLVGARGLDLAPEKVSEGRVRLVYPEIDQGLVVADVDVPNLGDIFVGERTRVFVATGTRMAMVVPESYIYKRYGIAYARVKGIGETVVQPGLPAEGGIEVLSGLQRGDVLLPPEAQP
jgi:multidrug efflux system membrane fusion protein